MWKKLLFASDRSEASRNALAQAIRIAGHDQCELHIVHVEELHAGTDAHKTADDAGLAIPANLNVIRHSMRDVSAAPALLGYAREHGIDLIVVGSHSRSGPARWFLGSVAQEVVRGATVPVLVAGRRAGAPTAGGPGRILAAVDFSPSSEAALRAAGKIAAAREASLIVVHVIDMANMPPYFANEIEAARRAEVERLMVDLLARSALPVDAEPVICDGRADQRIVETARDHGVGLIVTGVTGHGIVDRLLVGSTTERVLRSAPCPVLAYREWPAASA